MPQSCCTVGRTDATAPGQPLRTLRRGRERITRRPLLRRARRDAQRVEGQVAGRVAERLLDLGARREQIHPYQGILSGVSRCVERLGCCALYM